MMALISLMMSHGIHASHHLRLRPATLAARAYRMQLQMHIWKDLLTTNFLSSPPSAPLQSLASPDLLSEDLSANEEEW